MKKVIKRNSAAVTPQAESGMEIMMSKMQQQLFSLEKKLDTLISQSQTRPSEVRNFPKPFQHFDNFHRHDEGKHGNNFRERNFTKAVCADCHKECEVPFRPTGDRPVYCKECFAKRKSPNLPVERFDNKPKEEYPIRTSHFDKPCENKSHKHGRKKDVSSRKRK